MRIHPRVRLVDHGVTGKKTGRLEVYMDGKWGTVCDDYDEAGHDQKIPVELQRSSVEC